MQELAQAAYEAGLEMEDIKKLAAIGGWGKRAGNMQRDLMAHLHTCSTLGSATQW